jgi:hypothetical protein
MIKTKKPKTKIKKIAPKKKTPKITKKKDVKKTKKNVKIANKTKTIRKGSKIITNESYKKIIEELFKKGYDRKFVTFSEILSIIPYPEYNISMVDKIYDYLIRNNIKIIKNLKLLDTSEEISQTQLLKDSDPEE